MFEPTKELIDSSIEGFNSTIFAYGQTGSGKTYTLQGNNEIEGIAQKSFGYLHARLFELQFDFDFHLKCSMIQIYYSEMLDLLRPKN